MTHLAIRHTFGGLPEEDVRAILGDNAIDIYHFDRVKLTAVAERINAVTVGDLAVPLTAAPENGGVLAFRTVGPWY